MGWLWQQYFNYVKCFKLICTFVHINSCSCLLSFVLLKVFINKIFSHSGRFILCKHNWLPRFSWSAKISKSLYSSCIFSCPPTPTPRRNDQVLLLYFHNTDQIVIIIVIHIWICRTYSWVLNKFRFCYQERDQINQETSNTLLLGR